MRSSESLVEERVVGNCTVKVYYDTDPQHPDEGNDDLFLVSFSNDFHVVRKRQWESASDFNDFVHPRFQVDGWDTSEEMPEPASAPIDGPADPEWRRCYLINCTDELEVLLLEAGQDTDFQNPAGRSFAHDNFTLRQEIWDAWQRFKTAHSEWACFALDARNYGGGHIRLIMGDIYDGTETDKWGDPVTARGFVMVKKSAGWHAEYEKVAESLVQEWQDYCDGNVYGYVVTDDLEDEEIDSCWGFIGDQEYCMAEGVSAAEWHEKNGRKQVPLPFPPAQGEANG